jgi:ClpA/ClpB-like protein
VVFERFTEQARHAVQLAQDEARTLKHDYIGTEHILLGLLREEQGPAARVLEGFGVTVERVRTQVVTTVGSGDAVTSGQIPFTPRAKKVLELALREALSLNQNHIGTEHILLGLVGENEGLGARLLVELGAPPERIRELLRVRSSASGRVVTRDVHEAGLDWRRARLLWRPEGLELRIPLHLSEGSLAAFASDRVWATAPLAGLRREIWDGWLSLASPTLLDHVDPSQLRPALDAAATRAIDQRDGDRGRVEDFLRRLRAEP